MFLWRHKRDASTFIEFCSSASSHLGYSRKALIVRSNKAKSASIFKIETSKWKRIVWKSRVLQSSNIDSSTLSSLKLSTWNWNDRESRTRNRYHLCRWGTNMRQSISTEPVHVESAGFHYLCIEAMRQRKFLENPPASGVKVMKFSQPALPTSRCSGF